TSGSGDYTVTVPQLDSYGVVELSTTGTAASDTGDGSEGVHPWESFDDSEDPGSAVDLDEVGEDNETIHRFSSGWAWGGYSGNTDWGAVQQYTDWGGLCQFQNGAKEGSRIYTRFDQGTDPVGEGASQPDAVYDLTTAGATLALGIAMAQEEQDWAVLVRDGEGWWQSSAISIPELSWDTDRVLYFPVADLSWTEVDATGDGAVDMDQVDDGGESVLELGVRTDPDLCAVEGLGLVAIEDGSEQWSLNYIGLAHVGEGSCAR
ncbi:MAG: hypothetical protein QGG40_14115, partial [Myxococcota bacterium]|nr:hypothetical protein [Myxococcota bacterium]